MSPATGQALQDRPLSGVEIDWMVESSAKAPVTLRHRHAVDGWTDSDDLIADLGICTPEGTLVFGALQM